jgi:hypothetical protein
LSAYRRTGLAGLARAPIHQRRHFRGRPAIARRQLGDAVIGLAERRPAMRPHMMAAAGGTFEGEPRFRRLFGLRPRGIRRDRNRLARTRA